MTNILDMPAAEVEIPFSILDTDLYKVRPVTAVLGPQILSSLDFLVDDAKCGTSSFPRCRGHYQVHQSNIGYAV